MFGYEKFRRRTPPERDFKLSCFLYLGSEQGVPEDVGDTDDDNDVAHQVVGCVSDGTLDEREDTSTANHHHEEAGSD